MTPLERAERKSRLFHIAQACAAVLRFVESRTADDYDTDLMLRSAIERQLTIIGEAMMRLRAVDPTIASQITDVPGVIGFRNKLVHEYPDIDKETVWRIIQTDLPRLLAEVNALLSPP